MVLLTLRGGFAQYSQHHFAAIVGCIARRLGWLCLPRLLFVHCVYCLNSYACSSPRDTRRLVNTLSVRFYDGSCARFYVAKVKRGFAAHYYTSLEKY